MTDDDERKIGAVLLRGTWALLEKCTIAYRLRERAAQQFRIELRDVGYDIVAMKHRDLASALRGIDIALARDQDIDGAMKIITDLQKSGSI